MDIEQIFFHLTYAFLLISAITRLTPFTRFLQILAVLSLGSYLTLSTGEGYWWQIWSSAVVLIHLFFWKNYRRHNSTYESIELEIWNDYFNDVSEDDLQVLLDCSKWRKFKFNGTIISDKEYFVFTHSKESKMWQKLESSQAHIVKKGDLKLFVICDDIRDSNPLIEKAILHFLTTSSRTDFAS
jgi:hypothetical protein